MIIDDQHDLAPYIESVGQFGVHYGMPRGTARIMGYLLVCEPEYQPAQSIQKQLQLSAGAVSTSLNMLIHTGLIRQRTLPGDRKIYYELDPEGWKRAMYARLNSFKDGAQIANEGLKLQPSNPRLQQMAQLYSTVEKEVARIIDLIEQDNKPLEKEV